MYFLHLMANALRSAQLSRAGADHTKGMGWSPHGPCSEQLDPETLLARFPPGMCWDSSPRPEELSCTEGPGVMSIPLCKPKAQTPFPATSKGVMWEAELAHGDTTVSSGLSGGQTGTPTQSWAMGAGQEHHRT